MIKQIATRCNDIDSGARVVDMILTNTLLPKISHKILEAMLAGETLSQINIQIEKGNFSYQFS